MQGQQVAFVALFGESIYAGIFPDVGPVASESTQLHVVAMLPFAVPEHENQLVLAAIERSHAAIVFDPHAYVEERVIDLSPSSNQLAHVTPVHADEMDRTECAVSSQQSQTGSEKRDELGFTHLARSHLEFAMLDAAVSAGRARASRRW